MNFYIYVYLNPLKPGTFIYNNIKFNYEPFYVGKGKNLRMYEHLKLKGKNKIKNDILKTILSENKTPIIIKIYDNLSECDAFNIEVDLIKYFGRINTHNGILSNLTDGGEGHSGLIQSDETKLKRIQSLKNSTFYNTMRSDKFRKDVSNRMKIYYSNSENINMLRKLKMGKNNPMFGKSTSTNQKEAVKKAHRDGKIKLTEDGRRRIIENNKKRTGTKNNKIRLDCIKYYITSPNNEEFVIDGYNNFQKFCSEKTISCRTFKKYMNKLILFEYVKNSKKQSIKNTINWKVIKHKLA